jgi:hypothetical protein
MNYKEFFTLNNKSGIKSKESYISLNYPELYGEIKDFVRINNLNGLSFKEEIYYFINNKTEKHMCLNCGADVKFKGTINKGYSDYCSLDCANDSGDLLNRQKESIKKKYGVESTNQLDSVKNKKKESFLDKYGVDNPMKDKSIKTKRLESIKKKYGVDNVMKNDLIKNNHKDSVKNKYGVDNVFQSEKIKNKIKESNINNFGVAYPTQSEIVKTKIKNISKDKLLIRFPFIKEINNDILKCHCDVCNNEYEITRVLLNERNREGYGLCTLCNQVGINNISQLEKEVSSYIKNLINDEIKENDRNVLNNLELDVYIPSKKIAFEVNGLYWHSELFKDKNYHLNKTELCEEKGIRLIQIFEDEWMFKKDIVKSRIENILGLTSNKIYARKCEVREVITKESNIFLNNNHIQGECKSNIKLGLYYNNELVSLMTFGKGRVIMGGKVDEWELIRFCNKLNFSVVGGADKLLKHFIKEYGPKEIISYADRRWSQGELYDKLGFEFIHNSVANYWYINGLVREYRFKYRKSNLKSFSNYSDELTEHEIMLLNKRYRIYDCGNKRYVLNF